MRDMARVRAVILASAFFTVLAFVVGVYGLRGVK